MPLFARFILFDVIVESPADLQMKKNVSSLQVIVAYFARLAYATGNEANFTVPNEFCQITAKPFQEMENGGSTCMNQTGLSDFIQEFQMSWQGTEGEHMHTCEPFDLQIREQLSSLTSLLN